MGAGVVTAETTPTFAPTLASAFAAFGAAVMTAVASAAPTLVLTFAVFVKSKHDVFLRFHVAKIYL
jgi:hypothetical protein